MLRMEQLYLEQGIASEAFSGYKLVCELDIESNKQKRTFSEMIHIQKNNNNNMNWILDTISLKADFELFIDNFSSYENFKEKQKNLAIDTVLERAIVANTRKAFITRRYTLSSLNRDLLHWPQRLLHHNLLY